MSDVDVETRGAPVVRLALGWRAREVERRSTAPVRFSDQDVGVIVVEDDPVALAYADPAHAFTLPPGRLLRADQAAGRVFSVTATPHLEALGPAAALTLIDSVTRLFTAAGWTRVPEAGTGTAAVAEAARWAVSGNGGFGVTHVGTWHIARPNTPWAGLPPSTRLDPAVWNGAEAVVTVRPVRGVSSAADARLIVQVAVDDHLLGGELLEIVEEQRQQLGGEMQSLEYWDQTLVEPRSAPR